MGIIAETHKQSLAALKRISELPLPLAGNDQLTIAAWHFSYFLGPLAVHF
jgi:hypothetical protein